MASSRLLLDERLQCLCHLLGVARGGGNGGGGKTLHDEEQRQELTGRERAGQREEAAARVARSGWRGRRAKEVVEEAAATIEAAADVCGQRPAADGVETGRNLAQREVDVSGGDFAGRRV